MFKSISAALVAAFLLSGCAKLLVAAPFLIDAAELGHDAYCALPEETRATNREKLTGGRQYLCGDE